MRFSPSSLSVFRDCPRCFWKEINQKVKRPRGIFPSLPGGMDRVLKVYADAHRAAGTQPSELDGIGTLYTDLETMNKWRNWRTAPMVQIGDNSLSGALDDVVQHADGTVSPLDFKTRGAPPKDGASEGYYGPQLDAYDLLLSKGAGLQCSGKGYLCYFWPESVGQNGLVRFARQMVVLDTDSKRAVELVQAAASCLSGPIPKAGICEYCAYVGASIQ